MPRHSAGILFFRRSGAEPELLLVRPGGPFWRAKDIGAWQIPKGTIEDGETPETAARREAAEELGIAIDGDLRPLGTIRQSGGKLVDAFALERDIDVTRIESNMFEIEWPPRSGRMRSFPEVEEARWFTAAAARERMLPSQQPLIDRLRDLIATLEAGERGTSGPQ